MSEPQELRTAAHETFDENIGRLTAVIAVFNEEWKAVTLATRELRASLHAKTAAVQRGEVLSPSAAEETLYQANEERSKRVSDANDFLDEWHVVMLVTFTEAYLEDVLAACAAIDPDLMARSEQTVDYRDVQYAHSVEELLEEMRHRWARNFVDDGGPSRWIERLSRMGARGFHDEDGATLEELWGIRHVVVHAAGKVTRDFVRRHASLNRAAGERIKLDSARLGRYADAVFRFVSVTDMFVLRRYEAVPREQPPTVT